jgi:hypothetical protein
MIRHGEACRGMARHVDAWGSNGCDMGKVKRKHGCNAGRHGGGMEVSWVCHG